MKIPHVTRDSCSSQAMVRYCERFPDRELDLENYPPLLFGPDPIGVWCSPDSLYEEAIRRGSPLTIPEILRAEYFSDGKWSADGFGYDTMEEMLEKTDWKWLVLR